MAFVGGAIALSPLAAPPVPCWPLCVVDRRRAVFAWGARVGVFAFPLAQLALPTRSSTSPAPAC